MIQINLLYPNYLFLLFLIPFSIFIHFISLNISKAKALRFANFEAITRIKNIDLLSKNQTVLYLSIIIIFLLTFAISGTIIFFDSDVSSHSFVITIDASGSMSAEDLLPNRLEASKEAAINFIEMSPRETFIGVVSYSGISLIEQELTYNKELSKRAVNEIKLFRVGGTDIHEALITSVNLLVGQEAKSIILFSDGQINVGVLEGIISYAKDNDVIIHSIGVGTEEGGSVGFGTSRLNEETLKAISFNTGGIYMKLSEIDSNHVFEEMIERTTKKVPLDISPYLLLAAIILFGILFSLINLRYRGLP